MKQNNITFIKNHNTISCYQNNSYEDTFMHERAFNLGMFLKPVSVQFYITAPVKANKIFLYTLQLKSMIFFLLFTLSLKSMQKYLYNSLFVNLFILFFLLNPIFNIGIFLVIFLRLNVRKILYSIQPSFESYSFLFNKITKCYFPCNLKIMKKHIYNNNIKLLVYINFFSYSFKTSIKIQNPNIIFGIYKKVFKDSIQRRTGDNIFFILIKNVIN